MKPIYLLGDHHGDYEWVLHRVLRKCIRGSILIHVGDGAEGFPSWSAETAEGLNRCFESMDVEYLCIRGNHSNPGCFDGSTMLSHFKLLPDYTRMQFGGESWLFVGGAISIDRFARVPGKTWWPEEAMVLREDLAGPADVLVTHSGPSWLGPSPDDPFVLPYLHEEQAVGGSTLLDDLIAERQRHDVLFNLVKPKRWFFGHFHMWAEVVHQGCHVRLLDALEFVKYQ